MHALRFALYGLFALSGFCGLIYESIWSHYLRNYLGHAAHGQTVVLVMFVGGLALGAWLAGRYTARLREPLVAYAIAEIGIGIAALVFHPLYVAVTGWSYEALLPSVCGASGWCAAQWVVAALLIVAPAIALGTTFPWMVAGVLRRFPQRPGHEISVLYFLNSFGAVIGVLASAYVFVPWVGLPGTVRVAGVLNVAIGVIVGLIAMRRAAAAVAEPLADDAPQKGKAARRARTTQLLPPPAAAAPVPARSLVHTFLAVAALTGLASFVYEIAWIRMLSLVLGASTHAFELMLAAFIFGLAAGGAWIRNRIDRIGDPQSFLGYVQVWMGVVAIATLPLYGQVFELFGWLTSGLARSDPGYALLQVVSATVSLAVMLPATFLAGMTLPLITYRLIGAGAGERAIGAVYAANTVGAIAGVLAGVHLLMPAFGVKGALVGGALVDILLGVYLLRRPRGELAFSWPGFATVIAGLGVLGVVAAAVQVDPRRAASGVFREGLTRLSDHEKILYHADGKTATVTVVEGSGRRLLRTNGKTDASVSTGGAAPSVDEPTQALLGALAIGANPDAKRAAVIGIGSGISTAALLASPTLQRVDTIEIEPRMLEGAKAFGDRNGPIWSDPRSHFVLDDAKAWLARATQPFDVIVSEPSNPWVSGVASLFTVETYARIAKHLAPGGVFVQWVPIYETDGPQLSSMFRALALHFPHYVVYKGGPGDLLVIASRERRPGVDANALFADPTMAALLRAAGVGSAAEVDARWRGDSSVFDPLFAAYDAPANSDYYPYVDLRSQRTRYLATSFRPLFEAALGPTAFLEVLGANAPPNLGAGNALAAALADALAQPVSATATLPNEHAAYADALRATRELFVTCKPGGPVPVLIEGAVGTAMAINELPPARARAAWESVRSGACYRSLSPPVRVWPDLFAAIAARDAAAMSELGVAAVNAAPSQFARDYALSATVAADVALGRPEIGNARLESIGAGQESAWLMLLREASAGRTIAPATRGPKQASAK